MTEEKNKIDTDNKEEPEAITFGEFLMKTPPNRIQKVKNPFIFDGHQGRYGIRDSTITLYCKHNTCKGNRFFEYKGKTGLIYEKETEHRLILEYRCRNCKETSKLYPVLVYGQPTTYVTKEVYHATKLGESPPFGPHIPEEVLKLIESDRNLFMKGLEAENQSLGIGAFSYYRRVVENQKNNLIDQIIKVSEKLKASQEIIDSLKKAKEMTQFDSAVKELKHAIPESLLIDGCHNPLNLLHRALSAGLHAKSDDACLELAYDIRNVLTDLSHRLSRALKDDEGLRKSVSRLLNHHKTKE